MHETVIVGEAVAGEAAKIRRRVDAVVKTINTSVFEAIELLGKIKVRRLYTDWGFNTLAEYFGSLDMSVSKAKYLSRIGEVMSHPNVKIPRAQYEPLGIAKLRSIVSLDPEATYKDPTDPTAEPAPMADYIRGLVVDGPGMKLEQVEQYVRTLKGLVGENDQTHLNLVFLRHTLDGTITPAIEKMRLELGPVAKDQDGVAVEASPSRCIELICAKYLTEETDDDSAMDGSTDSSSDECVPDSGTVPIEEIS